MFATEDASIITSPVSRSWSKHRRSREIAEARRINNDRRFWSHRRKSEEIPVGALLGEDLHIVDASAAVNSFLAVPVLLGL